MPRFDDKSLLSPTLVECPGGILAGRVPLLSGVDYEFALSKEFTSVIQKTWVPEPYLDAQQLYSRHGLNEHTTVVAAVQEQIEKQKKATKKNDTGKHYIETTLFSFDEVEPYFLDYQGNKANNIFEGKNRKNVIWGYFFLKKKKGDTAFSPPAKVDRDNRRFRDDGDGGGNGRNVLPNNSNRNFGGSNQQQQFQMHGFGINPNGFGATNHQLQQGQAPFAQYPPAQFPQPVQYQQYGANLQPATVPHMGTMQVPQPASNQAAAWGHVNNGGYSHHINSTSGVGAGGLHGGTSGNHNQWNHGNNRTTNNNVAPNQQNFFPNAPPVPFGNTGNLVPHAQQAANIPAANANVASNVAAAAAPVFHAMASAVNHGNTNNGINANGVQNNNGNNGNVRIVRDPDEIARLLHSQNIPNAYPVAPNSYQDPNVASPITIDGDDIFDDVTT